jgi:hypothetical protein
MYSSEVSLHSMTLSMTVAGKHEAERRSCISSLIGPRVAPFVLNEPYGAADSTTASDSGAPLFEIRAGRCLPTVKFIVLSLSMPKKTGPRH